MHIVDGVLSPPVLVAGAAVTLAGTVAGLRSLPAERIPQTGVMSAAFFVASLIHVPVGPTSVHLILNGLVGLVLGWTAFPAVLIALLLQAVFFGFGGLVVLPVNAANVALPAVLLGALLRPLLRGEASRTALLGGFVVGAGAVALTALLVALSLALSGEEFVPAARLTFLAHLPVMAVEGAVTAAAVLLLRRVRPEVLALSARVTA